jgi:PAS domain S-box-containing protein
MEPYADTEHWEGVQMKFLKSLLASDHGDELNELREAVARHQRIFHGSHGYGYFDWDLMARRMDWSGGYWRYLGYTDDDVDYISVSTNYYDYIHPDDVEKVREAVNRILKKSGPGEVTYRTRRKKGGYIWSEIRADSVRDKNGWVLYISGIAFDVTKQKQTEQALLISEARHARIIQSSNDGIWEWAAEHGGFHFSNRCWEHLGYADHDDVVNQGIDRIQAWRRRMHPEDGVAFDRSLASHIRGEAPFDVEYRIRGKDDKWRWIRARGQMTFSEKGEPLRMSGTNMDITELKLAEDQGEGGGGKSQ